MTEMDYSRGPRCYCGFPDGVERDHPSYNGWSEQSIVEAHADVLETRRKVAEHPNTLEAADGLRRAILDLHRPVTGTTGDPYCDGCDGCGSCNPPDWPCTTYRLAAEALTDAETLADAEARYDRWAAQLHTLALDTDDTHGSADD